MDELITHRNRRAGRAGLPRSLVERSMCAAAGHRPSWWLGVTLGHDRAVYARCGRLLDR